MLPLFVTLLFGPAHAATVEVHPGDDVGQLTGSLNPGDEFIFHDGTYELERGVEWSGLGTEDEPIVMRAAQGATPVFRVADWVGVRVVDAEHFRIEGLVIEHTDDHYENNRAPGLAIDHSLQVEVVDVEVRHTGGTSLSLGGDNSGLLLTGLHLHDTRDGHGIHAGCGDASCWTQDSVIEHGWIHDLRGDGSRGILIEHGGQGITIRHNVIYQTGHRGIRTSSTEFGEANVIEGNVVWNAVHTGIRVIGAAVVRNNVVFAIDGSGISSDDNNRDTLESVVIAHNTVVDTTDWGLWIEDWAGATGMVLTNNVVANPTGLAYHSSEEDLDEGIVIGGNVLTGLVEGLDDAEGHFAPGGGYGDFEDVEGWNFYPVGTSTLIDSGTASSEAWVPAEDFNGAPRDGSAPDVGAYEYSGTGNPGWIIREDFKELGADRDNAQDVGGGCGCSGQGDQAMALFLPLLALFWRRRRA